MLHKNTKMSKDTIGLCLKINENKGASYDMIQNLLFKRKFVIALTHVLNNQWVVR